MKRRLVAEAQKAAVRPPAAANGMAIFPRGGGFWIEAYPSAEALAEHADDLLSDLFDPGPPERAAAASPSGAPAASTAGGAAGGEVLRLLEALWAAPLRKLEPIPGTGGDGYAVRAAGDGRGERRRSGAARRTARWRT